MHPQKTQSARSRPKFNVKSLHFPARIILFIGTLLAVIVTGVLVVTTGAASTSTALSGALTVILGAVAVIQIYPILFPGQSSTAQFASNTAQTSPNNIHNGSITQSKGTAPDRPIFFFNMPLRDPSEFYGHTAARTTLITRTANGGSSSIVGERRAGKTWLLGYLQLIVPTHSKLGSAYRIAYISAEHPRCKSLAGVVQWVLEELSISQTSHDLSLQPLDQLSLGVRALKKLGIRPVLCIDEFEGFDNRREFDVDFIEGLRAMAQSDGLILVTASKRPLKELIEDLTGQTSPLFNIVQQISLQPFTEQEAREFVRDKSDMAGFTKEESDFFFDQSTLHTPNGVLYWSPLRLQLVGQMLFDDKQAARGQLLDDKLDSFRYQCEFETRLNETYQAVVR
jgi:hypothetical protein